MHSEILKLVVNKLHYYRLFLWYGIQLQPFHLRPTHPKHHSKISLTILPPKQILSILKLMLRFLRQISQRITTLLLPQQHIWSATLNMESLLKYRYITLLYFKQLLWPSKVITKVTKWTNNRFQINSMFTNRFTTTNKIFKFNQKRKSL